MTTRTPRSLQRSLHTLTRELRDQERALGVSLRRARALQTEVRTGGPVRTLVADPPWPFGDALPGGGRGAAKHYRVMTFEDIENFPLPGLHADSWLFLWRVASMQSEALRVVEAWGYRVVTELVWVKCHPEHLPKVTIGMGRYLRNAHETCLVAVRGHALRTRRSASIPSVIFAPRGRHSEKPEAFYRLVEQLAPGPRVELFARRRRVGWACHGDELHQPSKRGTK